MGVTQPIKCMLLPLIGENTAVEAPMAARQATAFVGPPTAVLPSTDPHVLSPAVAAWTGTTHAHTTTRATLSAIRPGARIRRNVT